MLKMKKGCTVPFPERLFESYEIERNRIVANIGADKIMEVLRGFVEMHEEPQFFILELPTNQKNEEETGDGYVEKFHKDVYYIDGCSQEQVMTILDRVGDILINDGICCFGFGCHESKDEILFDKYNVMIIFSGDVTKYESFLERYDIPKVDRVLTAWDTFSEDNPGTAETYAANGETVFDIPKLFKDWGIYFAERREED